MPLHRRRRLHLPAATTAGASNRICVPFSAPFSMEKVGTTIFQALPQLRLLEVIRKKQLLLLRNRLFGNGRKLRRIRGEGGGGNETGEGEEMRVHGGIRSGEDGHQSEAIRALF